MQPGNLREAASAVFDVGDTVFKRVDHIGTRDFDGGQRVGEGQDRQHFAHGDLAFVDRRAQTAAVLDGDRGSATGRCIENGVGDEVAHRTFFDTANFAAAFDRCRRRADHFGHQLLERLFELGEAGNVFLIGLNRSVDEDRVALGRGHIAFGIEGDGEIAQVLAIGIGSDDRHFIAVDPVDHGRIAACGAFVGVGEQCVRVTAHDHVNTGDIGCDFLILGKAHMGQCDDLVDAFGGQGFGLCGEAVDDVFELDIVAG